MYHGICIRGGLAPFKMFQEGCSWINVPGGLRDMDVGSHEGLPVIKNSRSPSLVHFTATYLAHCTDERVASV